jgi:plasmid stabilization system protein ParE
MRVRYTLEALAHLDAIHSYIEPRNPVAAQRVIARIRAAADRLGEISLHPASRSGRRHLRVVGERVAVHYRA